MRRSALFSAGVVDASFNGTVPMTIGSCSTRGLSDPEIPTITCPEKCILSLAKHDASSEKFGENSQIRLHFRLMIWSEICIQRLLKQQRLEYIFLYTNWTVIKLPFLKIYSVFFDKPILAFLNM